ncbi:ElyC/SanA/YdcF family protein [Nonomuraea sp. NPDC049152]|uniref:SanA/YdcF family protein n=1 Tax=Nonomuraea sp. NPDC049152 TaxID=3154350 RepID=UPI0033E666BD
MPFARSFRVSRTAMRRAYQAAVALSVAAIAPLTWAWLGSDDRRVVADTPGWLEEVPSSGTALVLGAGLFSGQPSPMLARRLDIAAELYRAGKVRALLLSGDNSRKDYDEPSAMRDYLLARGVPDAVIVRDYAGFDTWDSCVRARQVFGARDVTVVTQVFHLPRAVTLCRTAGIETFGVGDDSTKQWAATTYASAAREFFAAAKALGDVVFGAQPVFPGPKETSLSEAQSFAQRDPRNGPQSGPQSGH